MKAELLLKREKRTKQSAIGSLFLNDKFFCFTLEDYDRDANRDGDLDDKGEEKVYGETAIPSGTYKVELSVSTRMKRLLPAILNVKGFDGIRMHAGNYAKDSLGCVLVGMQRGDDFVGTSKVAEAKLVEELKKYTVITITIQ